MYGNYMGFKYELIPEEQKEKFNFPVRVSRNGRKPTLYKWVIDVENGFYLVMADIHGGAYDGTVEQNTFYLHAYDEDVYIKATPLNIPLNTEGKYAFKWEITKLIIPSNIASKREDIILLIKESFSVWAFSHDVGSYDHVNVEFRILQ